MSSTRKPYPFDINDNEWAFVAPYLTLLAEDVSQRKYPLRKVFNGLRYLVNTGVHSCMLSLDLRGLLRCVTDRPVQSAAAITDGCTLAVDAREWSAGRL